MQVSLIDVYKIYCLQAFTQACPAICPRAEQIGIKNYYLVYSSNFSLPSPDTSLVYPG